MTDTKKIEREAREFAAASTDEELAALTLAIAAEQANRAAAHDRSELHAVLPANVMLRALAASEEAK